MATENILSQPQHTDTGKTAFSSLDDVLDFIFEL
jgi:hypothetical protein